MLIRGWVYVITNKAMPGLCKVGFSTKDPTLRAKELGGGGTGSPYPYIVIYDVLVENPLKVEQAVHRLLKNKREGKEWFRCSAGEAVRAVRKKSKNILNERIWSCLEIEDCCYKGCKATAAYEYKKRFYCDKHRPRCYHKGCEEEVIDGYNRKYYCAKHRLSCAYKDCKEKVTDKYNGKFYCDKHCPCCVDEDCEEKATDEYNGKSYCNKHCFCCSYEGCIKKPTYEYLGKLYCANHGVSGNYENW